MTVATPLRDRFEARLRRPPFAHARARALIERMEADPSARDAERGRLSARMLDRVGRTAWGAGRARLEDLPFLTKDEVRANPDAFQGRTLGPVLRSHTSGTSGAPLEVARSLGCMVFEQAAIDWVAAQAGLDLATSRVAVLRGADLRSESQGLWAASPDGRRLTFSANQLNRESFPAYAEALKTFRPDILYGYPSTLAALARLYAQGEARLSVSLVLTSSEVLLPAERRLVAQTFGARTADYYGQAERAAFAYSLEPGVYRFLAAYGVAELTPLPTGEAAAFEIVGSAFHNAAQLLPRYRTGDSIVLDPGADPVRVAAGLDAFDGVRGRLNDTLRGPQGEVLVGVDHIPRGLHRFERLQFVQTAPDHVRILVIGGGGDLSREDVALVLQRARLKLPQSMRIDVVAAEAALLTASGKAPLVISQLDGEP